MLLKLQLPEQEHGSLKDLNFLEIDSETTVVTTVFAVEKSEYHTRYHLSNQQLRCTSYPSDFKSIILKQSNSTKIWTLDVEFKASNSDDRDSDPYLCDHQLKVSSVKEVSSFLDVD